MAEKSDDDWQESEFTYEGVHYVGIAHTDFTCVGCALDKNIRACMYAPFCSSRNRDDRRNLIFMEK